MCECGHAFKPFPTRRRILTQKHQTTFENIVAKGEIARDVNVFNFIEQLYIYI